MNDFKLKKLQVMKFKLTIFIKFLGYFENLNYSRSISSNKMKEAYGEFSHSGSILKNSPISVGYYSMAKLFQIITEMRL